MQMINLSQVPSLYVRVYRWRRWFRQWICCSLIICEGISARFSVRCSTVWFPHYMWGYIMLARFARCPLDVPSLYVRVYRIQYFLLAIYRCSLIICEGISWVCQLRKHFVMFPHYMWGYITIYNLNSNIVIVPSLYVRVYRKRQNRASLITGSLIICEGISA